MNKFFSVLILSLPFLALHAGAEQIVQVQCGRNVEAIVLDSVAVVPGGVRVVGSKLEVKLSPFPVLVATFMRGLFGDSPQVPVTAGIKDENGNQNWFYSPEQSRAFSEAVSRHWIAQGELNLGARLALNLGVLADTPEKQVVRRLSAEQDEALKDYHTKYSQVYMAWEANKKCEDVSMTLSRGVDYDLVCKELKITEYTNLVSFAPRELSDSARYVASPNRLNDFLVNIRGLKPSLGTVTSCR